MTFIVLYFILFADFLRRDHTQVRWHYDNKAPLLNSEENTPWETIDFMTAPYDEFDCYDNNNNEDDGDGDIGLYADVDALKALYWDGLRPARGDDSSSEGSPFVDVALEESALPCFYVPLCDMMDIDDSVEEDLAPPLYAPLHTMRLVDLLARKRALKSRIAAASFVRALTHTSQVRRPPLEGSGCRNLVRRARVYRSCGVVRAAID